MGACRGGKLEALTFFTDQIEKAPKEKKSIMIIEDANLCTCRNHVTFKILAGIDTILTMLKSFTMK